MARQPSKIYLLTALGLCLAIASSAQDFRSTSGASTSLGPAQAPSLPPQRRIANDRTIATEEAFATCGQRCSFEAASEAMTAMTSYFQSFKQSATEASNEDRRQNVLRCTSSAPGPCNQQELLDSALHYSFGRAIRHAYLSNETHRVNIVSFEREKLDEMDFKVEQRNAKWLTGEGTWKETIDRHGTRLENDGRRRRPFSFDLDDQALNTPDNQDVAELDGKFFDDYRSFFQSYQAPEDRLFGRRRTVADNTNSRRGSISDSQETDTYDLEERGDRAVASAGAGANSGASSQANPRSDERAMVTQDGARVDDELRREAQERYDVAFRNNRQAVDAALEFETNPRGISVPRNQPRILDRDRDYLRTKETNFPRIRDRYDAELRSGRPLTADMQRYLSVEIGVPDNQINNPSAVRQAMDNYIRDLRDRIRAQGQNASSPRQFAQDLNRQFENLARQDDTARQTRITTDMAAFDNFLEGIWPTDAGTRLREEYQREITRDRTAPRIRTQGGG